MVEQQIYNAKVMHKRFLPKINAFNYSIYYLSIPLSEIEDAKTLSPFLSFKTKDHGAKDGSDLRIWIDEILAKHNLKIDGEIILIAMPRIFGYVFNPVSFWMCFNKKNQLICVLSEVNNTFGETHSYICHNDGAEITANDNFSGEKLFHVSPFLEREGSYNFRFDYKENKLGIWIDYFNENGDKILITSLIGKMQKLTKKSLLANFLKHPMITFKVIILIHYQALKLFAKGIKYICKPEQKETKVSLALKD